MPTTQSVHQKRWEEVVHDPSLRDLPYKVETNARGQIILNAHKNWHSKVQSRLFGLLGEHAPPGFISVEYAVATDRGTKAADVIWASPEREEAMDATGDPTTLAPEICIEVMSPTNSEEEMQGKRALYRDAGADEVWVVAEDGTVRFFAKEEREQSRLAPEFPRRIEV